MCVTTDEWRWTAWMVTNKAEKKKESRMVTALIEINESGKRRVGNRGGEK